MGISKRELSKAASKFASRRSSVHVVEKETGNIEKYLRELPQFLRNTTLRQAVRQAGRVVANEAKKRAPVGDTSHNPEAQPLKRTITVTVRDYNAGKRILAVVGPKYPQGAHGHLLEHGHKVLVSRGPRKGQAPLTGSPKVEGKKYLQPAIDSTKAEQRNALVKKLQEAVVKHKQEVGNG